MVENSFKMVVHVTSVFWWLVAQECSVLQSIIWRRYFQGDSTEGHWRALPVTPLPVSPLPVTPPSVTPPSCDPHSLKWWLSFSTDGAVGEEARAWASGRRSGHCLPVPLPALDPGTGHGGGDRHRVGLRRALFQGRRWEALKICALLVGCSRTGSTQSFLRCWSLWSSRDFKAVSSAEITFLTAVEWEMTITFPDFWRK